MKISVIIPTYKPQSYIWECLDSIKNQTFSKSDFETIIVLNGCNEPYYSQIREHINNNFAGYNVNFIQTDIGGVSNARNIALDVAKGEYITFIDDDDYISSSYLDELYNIATPDTISLCYPYAFNDGHPEVQLLDYGLNKVYDRYCNKDRNYLSSKVRKFFSGPCMKLIPRSYTQSKRFDIRFKNGEDSIYMFLISDKIRNIRFTSSNAIYYRRYRVNSAITRKRTTAQKFINAIRMICEYVTIYAKKPFAYNFNFFVTRVLGAIKSILFTS